jgi:hypothetical protein
MPVGDGDLDAFLADHGVPVVDGTVTTVGILDEEQDTTNLDFSRPQVMKDTLTLTYRTSVLQLRSGKPIQVNGVAYRVKGPPQRFDDGKFSRATLGKA